MILYLRRKSNNGSNIWVHYVDSMKDLVKEYTELLKTKIICIPEDGGLYIRNMNEDGEEIGEIRSVLYSALFC